MLQIYELGNNFLTSNFTNLLEKKKDLKVLSSAVQIEKKNQSYECVTKIKDLVEIKTLRSIKLQSMLNSRRDLDKTCI